MKKGFLLVAFGIFLIFAVIAVSNPQRLYEILLASNKLLLLAGFVVSNVAILFRIAKWRALIGVPMKHLAPVQMLGIAIGNFTPGKAAEPLKAVLLKMKSGVAVSHSLASIIWERVFDVIVVIVFSIIAVFLVGIKADFLILSIFGIVLMVIAVAVGMFILLNRRYGIRLISFLMRFPVLRRLPENFPDLFYKKRISSRRLAASFALTLVSWILEGSVLYFALLALGVEIPVLTAIGIVALSIAIGFATLLPGGIGSTEIVIILLLGAMGVAPPVAAAGAIAARALTFWYNNVLGAAALTSFRNFNFSRVINA